MFLSSILVDRVCFLCCRLAVCWLHTVVFTVASLLSAISGLLTVSGQACIGRRDEQG